jgi:hypothetical protein
VADRLKHEEGKRVRESLLKHFKYQPVLQMLVFKITFRKQRFRLLLLLLNEVEALEKKLFTLLVSLREEIRSEEDRGRVHREELY